MRKYFGILITIFLLSSCTMRTVVPEEIQSPNAETVETFPLQSESPETLPPETDPPETLPPETKPPETLPPETDPPETLPPETDPPETLPPETKPPETLPPETDPPETLPPETDPPETLPPETDPPETLPPETDPPETLPPETDPPETLPPETDLPETLPPETDPPETLPSEQIPYSNIEYNFITTDYFIYALADNTSLAVQEYIGPKGIIVMQPVLDGYSVTGILPDAFADDASVQVCVTDSVTYVAETAFPLDIGAVYYADASIKPPYWSDEPVSMYWDWDTIAHIPWANREDHPWLFETEHAESALDPLHPNRIVVSQATTQIYCERSPEESFTYTIENGEVTVTGYTGLYPFVSVPAEIEGYPVTRTGFNSFQNGRMVHLQLPGTITCIDHFTANTAILNTVHILNGEDYVLGECIFRGVSNHLRVHMNCVGEMEYEDGLPEGCGPGSCSKIIVPEGARETVGFAPAAWTYPEE